MNETILEAQARQLIAERIARASTHQIPAVAPRHRLAQRLRWFADRIDN